MTFNKMKLKKIVLNLIIFLLMSCNYQIREVEANQYEILSLLITDTAIPPFPYCAIKRTLYR